jgi:hypothetical protein
LKLAYLQDVVKAFNNDSIRTDPDINNLIIKSEHIGSNEFNTYRFGKPVKFQVINAFITNRYGIMLIMKDEQGKSFDWEYFD